MIIIQFLVIHNWKSIVGYYSPKIIQNARLKHSISPIQITQDMLGDLEIFGK